MWFALLSFATASFAGVVCFCSCKSLLPVFGMCVRILIAIRSPSILLASPSSLFFLVPRALHGMIPAL
jgi:hypothetical protein